MMQLRTALALLPLMALDVLSVLVKGKQLCVSIWTESNINAGRESAMSS
jgi:hypothetical protein